jgi:guanylate kinase
LKKYRLRVGLDVDDILYDCNAYALQCLNEREGIEPPLTIYDIRGWGTSGTRADERITYFSDPDFVEWQPMFAGAKEFVQRLSSVADVFFVTAVPPACMSARAMRLVQDFPEIPPEHILIGTRKDMVNLDILLDDGAHNITRTPATYPVLFRRPWNTHLSGLLSVNSYDDFLHLVDMICHAYADERPSLSGGGVVCLVGPTGTNKNAVARMLSARYGMVKPATATTRPRREGEEDNNYRFLDENAFIKAREAGKFLETTVYSGHYFGTTAADIDDIVNAGKCAVIPIDICGALTLKNRYRSRALTVFMHRERYDVIRDIVSRDLLPDDKTCRILSLDDEYRNEELCDLTVSADRPPEIVAADVATACEM